MTKVLPKVIVLDVFVVDIGIFSSLWCQRTKFERISDDFWTSSDWNKGEKFRQKIYEPNFVRWSKTLRSEKIQFVSKKILFRTLSVGTFDPKSNFIIGQTHHLLKLLMVSIHWQIKLNLNANHKPVNLLKLKLSA